MDGRLLIMKIKEYTFPCGHKITSTNIDFVGCRISAKKDGIIFFDNKRCIECNLTKLKQYHRKNMTNYEYIKTLSKDEMARFIMGTMSEAFDVVTDEMCNCWREEEAQAAGLNMWKEWLDKEHK